jgi:hypothetical protein
MDSMKAPGTLSRRASKATIVAELAEAERFADAVKAEAVKAAKLMAGDSTPLSYLEGAARRLRIRVSIGRETSLSYHRAASIEERPIWFHVWSFEGTRRASYGTTEMVIRKDGALNTEYLVRKIANEGYRDMEREINAAKTAAVAMELERAYPYKVPEGYKVTPAPQGATVTYEKNYSRNLYLSRTVPVSKVAALISAHERWVEGFNDASD